MTSNTAQMSAAPTSWGLPPDTCRWRYVPGTNGWKTCQHNHVTPSAAELKARAKRAS